MKKIDALTGRLVLARFLRERSPLAALQVLYERMGHIFEIPLPGFRARVTAGPSTNRQVLVTDRDRLLWRTPGDPVTHLLRQGVLVVDGEEHDRYRALMEPALSPSVLPSYVSQVIRQVDRVASTWQPGGTVDMLAQCRRIALLIVMQTLFTVDFWEDMPRLWKPILKAIEYISPGAWLVFPGLPRWGYRKPIQTLDNWLLSIIQARRSAAPCGDLLGHLIAAGLDDAAIRDQMLTVLIAGHDTTTALLAWTFYLLGSHPEVAAQLQTELEQSLHGQAPASPSGWQPRLLDAVIKESLRLYPPIHLGNRRAASDLEVEGCPIHTGERLMYSIYLTHHDPQVWPQPDRFDPSRFIDGPKSPPYGYLPFGAGPRACMGAAYGMVEARLVLARLLQTFRFELIERRVRVHMGATLEPRPGVRMRVSPISQL